MATTTTNTTIGVSTTAGLTLGQRLMEKISSALARFRAYWADRRMRDALADLSDAQLLDIGIAEDEISRIRAFEVFTPRSWADPRGKSRRSVL